MPTFWWVLDQGEVWIVVMILGFLIAAATQLVIRRNSVNEAGMPKIKPQVVMTMEDMQLAIAEHLQNCPRINTLDESVERLVNSVDQLCSRVDASNERMDKQSERIDRLVDLLVSRSRVPGFDH